MKRLFSPARMAVPVALMLVLLTALPALAGGGDPDGSAGATLTTVATGLDNAFGLSIGDDGAVYVATGGPEGKGPCASSPGPEGGKACYGTTGAIIRIKDGQQERAVTGLPTFGGGGPSDVAIQDGQLYALFGQGGPPQGRNAFGEAGAIQGTLVRINEDGGWTTTADIAQHEADENPAGGDLDTNPYMLTALSDGFAVVDAGGNDLLGVSSDGDVSTLAVFPSIGMYPAPPEGEKIPAESVPTSVAVGPDGSFYVGELTGFPFPVGEAKVYRVAAGGGEPEVYAEGFSAIGDVAFGPDGSLYVLEIARKGLLQAEGPGGDPSGQLTRIAPDGERTVVASEGLVRPTSVAVADDGTIYITNFGGMPDKGQVVRLDGLPEMPESGGGGTAGGGFTAGTFLAGGVALIVSLITAAGYITRRYR